jgi:hypothetical protein
MITAELDALHRLARERRQLSQDDSPQPVLASATLNSRRPALVPEYPARIGPDNEPADEAPAEAVASRHDRRRGDQPGSGGEQRHDRRQQTLPTLIDTRSTRPRRRSDNGTSIDFEI